MQIGIVGAGIGGLAAAKLLAQAGHQVALAERFATPQPVGSGLVVQPVGLAVLDALGAGDAARELGAPLRVMQGRQDGRRAADRLPAGRRPPPRGCGLVAVPRGACGLAGDRRRGMARRGQGVLARNGTVSGHHHIARADDPGGLLPWRPSAADGRNGMASRCSPR